jgi:hypothetical protein
VPVRVLVADDDEALRPRGDLAPGEQSSIAALTTATGDAVDGTNSLDYELVQEMGIFGRRRAEVPVSGMENGYAVDGADMPTAPGVEVAGRRVPSVGDILGRSRRD